MKIAETEVFFFSELDDRAKERARDWYREGLDYDWWDDTLDQAREIGAVLGFDIPSSRGGIAFRGFASQGDGASFAGTWRAPSRPVQRMKALGFDWSDESFRPLLEMADSMAVVLCAMTQDERDNAITIFRTGRGVHAGAMRINEDYREATKNAEDLLDIARDFAHWIYRSLEREWDDMNATEQVDESIIANEYTFTADGEWFG